MTCLCCSRLYSSFVVVFWTKWLCWSTSDVNECLSDAHSCDARENFVCTNTRGSYECVCQTGFTLRSTTCMGKWLFYQKAWNVYGAFADKNNSYRVGSANFSQRKIGHAHDNSANSENVAGAPQRSVHVHFIFCFENGRGNQSFFLSMTKIQLKRVNHKLSRRTIDAPWTGLVREVSSGP